MEKFKLVRDYTETVKGDGHNTYGKKYTNGLYDLYIEYIDDSDETTYMEHLAKKEFVLFCISIKIQPIEEEYDNYPAFIYDDDCENLPYKNAYFKIRERNTPILKALFGITFPEIEMDIDDQEALKLELVNLAKPLIKEMFPEDCTYRGSKAYYKEKVKEARKQAY